MSWSIKFTDNFNRANENPLKAPWQNYGGGNPGPCSLNTNKVWEQNGAGILSISHYNNGTLWKNDQYSEALIDSTTAYNAYFGIAVRFGGGGIKRGYFGVVLPLTLQWSIHRYSSPADTAIAGGPYGVAGNHVLRLEVKGTLFSLYKQGVLLGTVNDANFSIGYPGVVATIGALKIDDWKGGEWINEPWKTGKYYLGSKPKMRLR